MVPNRKSQNPSKGEKQNHLIIGMFIIIALAAIVLNLTEKFSKDNTAPTGMPEDVAADLAGAENLVGEASKSTCDYYKNKYSSYSWFTNWAWFKANCASYYKSTVVPIQIEPITLEVQPAFISGKAGDTIPVSILLKDANKLAGLSVALGYDADLLEANNVSHTLDDFLFVSLVKGGKVRMSMASAYNLGKDNAAININFKIIKPISAPSALNITGINSEEPSAFGEDEEGKGIRLPVRTIDSRGTIEPITNPGITNPILCEYDYNKNGKIERVEATAGVTDHLLVKTQITRQDATDLVTAHLLAQKFKCI